MKVVTTRVTSGRIAQENELLMPRYSSIAKRFWKKVNKNGPVPEYAPHLGRCWLWTGATTPASYGLFRVGRRLVYAHRWAYGSIPDGLETDHLCRVRRCVRRSHTELVTHQENVRRGEVGITNRSKMHCPAAHRYDEANTYHYRGGWYCRMCRRERERVRHEKARIT